EGLLKGNLKPGERLKIRDLAATLGVSETPIREAIMQLVREGGLEIRASQAIRVVRLGLARYLELRDIRLLLEGLAAERATPRISSEAIDALEEAHQRLIRSEQAGEWSAALEMNYVFHHSLYRAAAMPALMEMLERMWLQVGPLLNLMYPHARPTYRGRHQHLNVLDALRRHDAAAARSAIQEDMIEGGAGLVQLLERMEAGKAVPPEIAAVYLEPTSPPPRPAARGLTSLKSNTKRAGGPE
ncbi:MAG: GntR family transcriptional regulator, partial [candidate division NC10 bacterium]|nr:GntR family transcriptional regulator [candidate division NC10 bacterium]